MPKKSGLSRKSSGRTRRSPRGRRSSSRRTSTSPSYRRTSRRNRRSTSKRQRQYRAGNEIKKEGLKKVDYRIHPIRGLVLELVLTRSIPSPDTIDVHYMDPYRKQLDSETLRRDRGVTKQLHDMFASNTPWFPDKKQKSSIDEFGVWVESKYIADETEEQTLIKQQKEKEIRNIEEARKEWDAKQQEKARQKFEDEQKLQEQQRRYRMEEAQRLQERQQQERKEKEFYHAYEYLLSPRSEVTDKVSELKKLIQRYDISPYAISRKYNEEIRQLITESSNLNKREHSIMLEINKIQKGGHNEGQLQTKLQEIIKENAEKHNRSNTLRTMITLLSKIDESDDDSDGDYDTLTGHRH